jgi:hypothetical protein
MDLFLFRLSLKLKEKADLFEARDLAGNTLTREAWLRQFFNTERTFTHYRSDFIFVPEHEVVAPRHQHLIFGWIGRQLRRPERTPPSEGFEPTQHESWQAAFIAIDPTDHDEGQLAAIEFNVDIGQPKALLTSVVRTLNSMDDAPYFTQSFPLVSAGTFWDFAASHKGEIVSVTFDVVAPNMFRDADDFQEDLRSLREKENVAEVRSTLKSDTLLNHTTPRMKSIVDYVERGAGELSAEAFDGSHYRSTAHERKESVDIEPHSRNKRRFLRDIIVALDRIFP